VGFYSAFIVADKVSVLTRRAGEKADQGVRWESDGGGEFSIEMVEKAARGTEITLHLREGQDDLLAGYKLREIIRKYSNHIVQPILMQKEEWKDGKYETLAEDETVNQASGVVGAQQERDHRRAVQGILQTRRPRLRRPAGLEPCARRRPPGIHATAVHPVACAVRLYDRQARHGIKLYVRRVFIMDDAEQLMPQYMRFVRGVVDSADLPLNVSREILQESKDIEAIRKGCTGKVLACCPTCRERQGEICQVLGRVRPSAERGRGEDFANKDKIRRAAALRHHQGDTAEQTVSLKDYIARMKDGQEKIYFVTADSFNAAKNSPHLEVFRKKGIEVLLLSDRVDEWCEQSARIRGQQLVSVAKGASTWVHWKMQQRSRAGKAGDEFKGLTDKIKTSLADKVKEVRVTHRSPTARLAWSRTNTTSAATSPADESRGTKSTDLATYPRDQSFAPVVQRLKVRETL